MNKLFSKALVCLLAVAAVATAPAAMAACRIYPADCSLVAGGTANLTIMMDNDEDYLNFQMDIHLPDGIRPVFNGGYVSVSRTSRTNGHTVEAAYETEAGANLPDGVMRVMAYSGQNRVIAGNSGAVVTVEIEADESLEPGTTFEVQAFNIVTVSAEAVTTRIELPDEQFNINIISATPLADVLSDGTDGNVYLVQEKLTVVEVSEKAGSVFASDGDGNWIRIVASGDVLEDILDMSYIDAESLVGTLSDVDRNPTLTIAESPVKARRGTKVEAEDIAMTGHFDLLSAQVINVEGYYYVENGVPTLRAYYLSDRKGSGKSLTLCMDWCDGEAELEQGSRYLIESGVVQLKEAWSDRASGAPRRIASTDDLAFQNYIVYPLYPPELVDVPTGINTVGDDAPAVSVSAGHISAGGARSVGVYAIDGRLMGTAAEQDVPAGAYIVVADGHATKVVVK